MKNSLFILLITIASNVNSQALVNTSYKNEAGEKVLRLEFVLPVDINQAWQLFTNDNQLKKWIAPLAHIELKTGGYILTNYNSKGKLEDSNAICLQANLQETRMKKTFNYR